VFSLFTDSSSAVKTNNEEQDDEFDLSEDKQLVKKRYFELLEDSSVLLNVQILKIQNKHTQPNSSSQVEPNQLTQPIEKQSLTEFDPKQLAQQAFQILRETPFDSNAQKEAFEQFKATADKNDLDACWMVAACMICSIGSSENIQQVKIYSTKGWMWKF
jgi:hypothetical protein